MAGLRGAIMADDTGGLVIPSSSTRLGPWKIYFDSTSEKLMIRLPNGVLYSLKTVKEK